MAGSASSLDFTPLVSAAGGGFGGNQGSAGGGAGGSGGGSGSSGGSGGAGSPGQGSNGGTGSTASSYGAGGGGGGFSGPGADGVSASSGSLTNTGGPGYIESLTGLSLKLAGGGGGGVQRLGDSSTGGAAASGYGGGDGSGGSSTGASGAPNTGGGGGGGGSTVGGIGGSGGAGGSGIVILRFLGGVPPNDNFSSATELSGTSDSGLANTALATSEAAEPSRVGQTAFRSVWWRWVAPASGNATITTFGSNFDTVLGVFTGSALGTLNLVAENDDHGGFTSQVSFNAVAGTTYHIAVDGFGQAAGVVTMSLQFQSAPNMPPVLEPISVSTVEGETRAFVATEFTAAYTDPEASPLASITVTALPSVGVLKLSGVAVETEQTIPAAQLGNLSYQPAVGDLGYRSFTVTASDGGASSAPAVVTVQVVPATTPSSVLVISGAAVAIGVSEEATVVETAAIPAGARVVGVDLALEYSTYWDSSNPAIAGNYLRLGDATIGELGWVSAGNYPNWTAVSTQYRGLIPAYVAGSLNSWVIGSSWNPVDLRAVALRVYYTGGNTAPTIAGLVDTTTAEDTPTSALAFTVGDAETAAGSLTVTATSSNTTLIPNANLVLGGSGANRTLTATPAANQSGTSTITVTVSDGVASTSATFVLTVTAVNDAPTIAGLADTTTAEDTPTSALAFTVGDAETAAGSLTVTATSSNTTLIPNANLVLGGSGANRTLTATPAANQSGTSTITVTVSDGVTSTSATFVLTVTAVNDAPTIAGLVDTTTAEDTPTSALAFTVGDAETAAGSLTVTATSSNTTLVPNANLVLGGSGANRTLTATPAANQSGTSTITVTVSDGVASTSATFVLTVTAVNDAPTIAGLVDTTTPEDTATSALAFTVGDAETAAGSLTVTATSSNTTLVPNANLVLGGSGANRTLTATPAANQSGTSTITVTVSDGVASTSATFVLTVTAVNDAPTIAGLVDTTTTEDTATSALAFTVGDAETAAGSLTVTATSSNTTLVPNANLALGGSGANRTLTATPAANQSGTSTITVTVSDGVASTSATFVLTVTAVNDAPVLEPISVSTVEGETRAFVATEFTAAYTDPEASPLASITVTALPSVGVLKLSGVAVETGQTISAAQLGNLSYQPAVGDLGYRSFTVTASDGGASSAPAVVTVQVVPATTPSSVLVISGAAVAIGVSAEATVVETAAIPAGARVVGVDLSLEYSTYWDSSNPAIAGNYLRLGDATIGELGWVSVGNYPNWTAVSTQYRGLIPAYVAGSLNSWVIGSSWNPVDLRAVALRVYYTGGNTAPTIAGLIDTTTAEDTPTSALAFTVGDAETAAGSLTVTATSSNTTLVPNANLVLGGSGANRTLTATPAANQSGTSTITVTVSDGVASTSATFVLTVTAVNDAPTIAGLVDTTTAEDTPTSALAFTVGDAETAAGSLTVTATSSNTTLVPNANLVLGGSGAGRTLTATPAANQSGTSTITVTVSDGVASTSATFVLTVTAVNDAPTIAGLVDTTTAEDTPTSALAFTVGDAETAAGSLTVTATSSNTTLVPNANLVLGGSGANRTLTATPAANQSGTSTITVTVSDGAASTSATFVLTVTAVNDAPTIAGLVDTTTAEDTPTSALAFTVGDAETAAGSLTVMATSSNTTLIPNANLVLGGSGANRTLTATPAANQSGTSTITVTVSDGVASTSATFVLTVTAVNDAPTIAGLVDTTTAEDTATSALAFTVGDAETAAGSLTVTATSSNTTLLPNANLVLGGSGANRTLTATPAANQSGTSTITVTVSDGVASTSATFVLTVTAVNDLPTLVPITVSTVEGVSYGFTATNFTAAYSDPEGTSLASITVATLPSVGTLKLSNVAVTAGQSITAGQLGNLAYEPAAGDLGYRTFTVTASDGSGSSEPALVTVQMVPSTTPSSVLVISGATLAGVYGEATVTETAMIPPGARVVGVDLALEYNTYWDSGNPAVAGNYVKLAGTTIGELGWTSFGNSPNWTTVTTQYRGLVTGYTAGSLNAWVIGSAWNPVNLRAVALRVYYTGGNYPPTIAGLVDATTAEDTPTSALAFIVGDTETAAGSLTVTATSSNTTLIPNANLVLGGSGANRTLTATPAANQSGTSTITVTVSDGVASTSATFVLTVTAVNDAPTIAGLVDTTTAEDTATSALAFTVGDAETAAGSLTVTATSSNTTLVPNANLVLGGSGANRTLTATPAANQSGTSTITVTVSDGVASTSATFVLTVTAVNDAPTIAGLVDTTTAEDTATSALAFTVGDAETAAGSLTVTATSSNTTLVPNANLVLGGSGANRTLTATPAANQSGTSTITVTVSDGVASTSATFVLTVTAVNDAPTIAGLVDTTTAEDTATSALAFTVGDAETAAGSLTVTATSSNTTLVPNANLVLGGSGANRTLTATPAANQSGTSTITVTVSDGVASTSATFVLTVTAVNDAPTIAGLVDTTTAEDTPTSALAFTVGDAETAAGSLTVTATSSNTTLVPNANLVLGGSGANRTLTATPAANQSGTSTITVTVSDGVASTSASFVLTVTAVNDAPVVVAPPTATLAEDTSLAFVQLLAIGVLDADDNLATVRLTVTHGVVSVNLASGATVTAGANSSATVTLTGSTGPLAETLASLVFTPTADYHGPAALEVLATDAAGATATATVGLAITPVADIAADSVVTMEDVAVTVNVLANDSFAHPAAVVSAVTQPSQGVVTFTPAGAVTYAPAANSNGPDAFTYTVTSGGTTETATVSVLVTAVNDAPVHLAPATATTSANTPLIFSAAQGNALGVSDPDAGAAALTVTLAVNQGSLTLGPAAGIVFSTGDGSDDPIVVFSGSLSAVNSALATVTYAPPAGFSGPVTLSLSTSDNGNTGAGGALVDSDTVAITVRDTIAPFVVGLAAVSPDGHYRAGAAVDLAVTFSEPIVVESAGGTPSLQLETGAVDRLAAYVSGSGTPVLLFRYVVAAGDTTADLNHFSTTALSAGGSVLRDAAGNSALLTLPATAPGTPGALATAAALVIDTTAPTVTLSAPSVSQTGQGPVVFTATFADAHLIAPVLTPGQIVLHPVLVDSRLVAPTATVSVSGTGAVRTITLAGISGDGTLAVSVAAGAAVDRAGNASAASAPSAAFTVQNTFPIAVVTPPAGVVLAVDHPLILGVTVTGTAPTYRWFKDNTPLEGATRSTYELAAAPLGAAGTYRVEVGNVLGTVEAGPAVVSVVDVTATHAPVGPGYVAGQALTVRGTLTFNGGDGTLGWSLLLPPGWTYLDGESSAEVRPAAGAGALLEWQWRSFPLSPVTFTARLLVPSGTSGLQDLAAQIVFTRGAVSVPLLARPDPLRVSEIGAHAADLDANYRFALDELLRVIELYNVRNATVRTGAYQPSPGTEDGFAPDFLRRGGDGAPLARYHSADSDRDGRIGLSELTRMIELFNHRSGSVRTGEFHRRAGTEDGYAGGPAVPAP